jgi:hypothetical protein
MIVTEHHHAKPDFLELTRVNRNEIFSSLAELLLPLVGARIDESFWVPTALFTKVGRCEEAIRLLVDNGLASEAASVAITQFELRLDLMYLELDQNRSTTWADHEDPKREPWGAIQKINSLYPEGEQRDAQFSVYRRLCQAKHSNPVGLDLAIPIRGKGRSRDWIISPKDEVGDINGRQILIVSALSLIESAASFGRHLARFITVPNALFEALRVFHTQIVDEHKELIKEQSAE